MSLEYKYLKYRYKYLELKKQIGGECNPVPPNNYVDPIFFNSLSNLLPNRRITINGHCYDIEDIYKWAIILDKRTDSFGVPISEADINRLISTYNNINVSQTGGSLEDASANLKSNK